LKLKEDYEKQIDMWVLDENAYLPRGWSRIKCTVCNEDEHGIILNPSSGIGKYVFEQHKDYMCNACRTPLFS
jgi:hypothetical protein